MSKHWCFTLNNPDEDEYRRLYDNMETLPVSYIVIGKELSASGTEHLQGYVAFKTRKRLGAVKNFIPGAHWEIKRGTPKQAADYCKKEQSWKEFGEFPDTGGASGGIAKAERYRSAIQLAKRGAFDMLEDLEPAMYFNHYHTVRRIRQDYMTKAQHLDDVCGEWIWGPPGVGKSHLAREENPVYYDKMANKWWDGYQQEPVAIIDDFDRQHKVLGHHLKLWGDKWSFGAEMKGTTVQIRPKKIVVTSNYSLKELFKDDDPQMYKALKRRFKKRNIINPWYSKLGGLINEKKIPPPVPRKVELDLTESEMELIDLVAGPSRSIQSVINNTPDRPIVITDDDEELYDPWTARTQDLNDYSDTDDDEVAAISCDDDL